MHSQLKDTIFLTLSKDTTSFDKRHTCHMSVIRQGGPPPPPPPHTHTHVALAVWAHYKFYISLRIGDQAILG
jgi:hypothetical protein